MRRSASLAAVAVLCLTLAGCSGRNPTQTPSPMSTPPPTRVCAAAQVLIQVKDLLTGQDFEAHYLTIAGQLTLSVWLVDPEIDSSATDANLAANNRKALARGLSLSYQIVDQIPCVRYVFPQVNPMIVDGLFQHWYRDFLPTGAFVGLHDPTTDDLIAAVQGTGHEPADGRKKAPQAGQPAPVGSCDWPEAKKAVRAYLGTEDNTAAYLLIGASPIGQNRWTPNPLDDVGVEVQWVIHDDAEAADSIVLERLGHLAQALTCLWPAIDSLEGFVVDETGQLVVYAIVPGSIIRAGAIPLPRGAVILQRVTPSASP